MEDRTVTVPEPRKRRAAALAARRQRRLRMELLERRDVPTVSMGSLLTYYAWPSTINGAQSVGAAAAEFSSYNHVVLGAGLERETHPDHANTAAIINHASTRNTRFSGYTDLGVTTRNLPMTAVKASISAWAAMGAGGVLLDDFGFDYGVSRARQNEAVDYAHSLGLAVVANGHQISDVFGSSVQPSYNPTGEPTHLQASDFYLFESYQIREGVVASEASWREKAEQLAAVRASLPIQVLAITTESSFDSFTQAEFDYAFWSAIVDDFTAFGWGEVGYSAGDSQAPYRQRPQIANDVWLLGSQAKVGSRYFRETTRGAIAVDASSSTSLIAGQFGVDFGDATDHLAGVGVGEYASRREDNGARHLVGRLSGNSVLTVSGPTLGASVDAEINSLQSLSNGVAQPGIVFGDNDPSGQDENGVRLPALLRASATGATSGSLVVNVQNIGVNGARVDGWVDLNQDGDWNDAGEQILNSQAVAFGDNTFTFTVPAGTASGETWMRIRVSSSGGLQPTGWAADGEVEDYRVLVTGGSELKAVESAIEAHLFGNGMLRAQLGLSFYDVSPAPRAWYVADPYFPSYAAITLLRAPEQSSLSKYDLAEKQLSFFLNRIASDGTLHRWLLDAQGNPPTSEIVVDLPNPDYLVGGTIRTTLTPDDPTFYPDAGDSANALIISLAGAYFRYGGEGRVGVPSLLGAPETKTKLEHLADVMLSMRESNGLTRGHLTPLYAGQPIGVYVEDNVEVLNALEDLALLERQFYGDLAAADRYAAAAAQLRLDLYAYAYNPATGLFNVLAEPLGANEDTKTKLRPNLHQLYADVQVQFFAIAHGLVDGTSPAARNMLDKVYAIWNGGAHVDWRLRTDNGLFALGAARAGDTSQAAQAIASTLPYVMRNGDIFPTSTAAACIPTPSAPDTSAQCYFGPMPIMSITDASSVLDALLPIANPDAVHTLMQTPVVIDVRSNDFSVTSPASELAVSLVTLPRYGNVVTRADGSLEYTPLTGYTGADTFIYQVQSPNQGLAQSSVTIQVNARPQLTLTVDRTSIAEHGGAAVGTISRGQGDQTVAVQVSLTSSDATEASVPVFVTIPAHEATATFPITAVDDALFDGDQGVTITASVSGAASTLNMIVVDSDLATTHKNPAWNLDVDADGSVIPLDALIVINQLNLGLNGQLAPRNEQPTAPFFDTSGDNYLSPLDALLVINYLNLNASSRSSLAAEGESFDRALEALAGVDLDAAAVASPHADIDPERPQYWLPSDSSFGSPPSRAEAARKPVIADDASRDSESIWANYWDTDSDLFKLSLRSSFARRRPPTVGGQASPG